MVWGPGMLENRLAHEQTRPRHPTAENTSGAAQAGRWFHKGQADLLRFRRLGARSLSNETGAQTQGKACEAKRVPVATESSNFGERNDPKEDDDRFATTGITRLVHSLVSNSVRGCLSLPYAKQHMAENSFLPGRAAEATAKDSNNSLSKLSPPRPASGPATRNNARD